MTRDLRGLLAAERRHQRGMLAKAALCALLVACASVALLGLSGWFITAAAFAGGAGPLIARAFNYMLPSAAIRLLAIVRTGARYGERLASHAAALHALARLRATLFRSIAAMPAVRALRLGLGDLSARMVQDVNAIEVRFVRLSAPWGAAGAAVAGTALVLVGGWSAALATLGCILVLLLLARRIAKQVEARGRQVQVAAGSLKDVFAAMAGAAPELRCYGLEGWAIERITVESRRLGEAQQAERDGAALFELLQAWAIGIAAVSALLLSAGAGAPVAAMAALAAAMAVDGMSPLLRDIAARGAEEEAGRRIDAILTSTPNMEEERALPQAAALTLRLDREYRLPPGARVCLSGPSGSGKTSLIEALLGLREMGAGRVAIGGHDLALSDPRSLRGLFGWASQDPILLAGSVRDNLLLARPDAEDEQLWAVLRDAAIDRCVAALPGGLDGWIGENGSGLSGGERRRLSLARALLSPAPWLLLDEPTEGLDPATEAQVIAGLERHLAVSGQGLLLVSHRPAPVALCERIVPIGSAGFDRYEPEIAA